MKEKVLLIYRSDHEFSRSIEIVFDILLESNPNKFQKFKVVGTINFRSILFNLVKILSLNPKKVHITGDVHYYSVLSLFGVKTSCTIHDINHLNDLVGTKKILYFFIWILLPIIMSNTIFTISPLVQKQLLQIRNKIKIKTPIILIPNPLTFSADGEYARNPLSLAKRKYDLIQIGTAPHKQPYLAYTLARHFNLKLAIVGKIPDHQIQYFNPHPNVSFFQNLTQDELVDLYFNSKCLIFLSTAEGFGLPILEGQACGCVVLTYDIEPLNWVLGTGGILFQVGDVEGVYKWLAEALIDWNVFLEITQLGNKNVRRFSKEKFINAYCSYFEND